MQQPDQKTMASYELMELIRSYGAIVGTPGMSEENLKMANEIIALCLKALQPNVSEQIEKLKTTAVSGIITK